MSIEYNPKFLKLLNDKSWTEDYTSEDIEKLRQAIEVHGYREASKGKHNGIVPIRPTDYNLINTLNRLIKELPEEIRTKCTTGFPIKVVAHVSTGWRMIGYRWSNGNIYIIGMGNYN